MPRPVQGNVYHNPGGKQPLVTVIMLKTGKDTYLFYSGPGGYTAKAAIWRNKLANRQYRILSMLWKDEYKDYPDTFKGKDKTLFDRRASQAMAENAEGVVYVMLPDDTQGTNWLTGTVWDKYEWPNLSSAVIRVVRINPNDDNRAGY